MSVTDPHSAASDANDARTMLDAYAATNRTYTRLGCDLTAHRDLGFCAVCRTAPTELLGWRLLAMAERGIPLQPWQQQNDSSEAGEPR